MQIPRAVRRDVTVAFKRLIRALDAKDVNYICGVAYSTDYLDQLQKQGGCRAVTTKKLNTISGYKAKVQGLNMVNPKLVEVYAELESETSAGAKKNETAIHFKKQSDGWKRFIYTGSNG